MVVRLEISAVAATHGKWIVGLLGRGRRVCALVERGSSATLI